MELLVFIKQVPDDSVEVKLDPSTGAPNLNGVMPVVNAFDTYALEMAVRFKEANGGSVTVATIGDDKAVQAIKDCLAVGADKGFLLKDDAFADSDATAKSYILSKAVSKLEQMNGVKYNIIFCGKESTDYAGGTVGIALASELGVACVTDVIAVEPADSGLGLKQMTDSGYNDISAAIPCVVTIQKPDYDPRYPTIKSKMKARKADVPVISAQDLGTDSARVGASGSLTKLRLMREPPKKQAGIKIQEESPADSAQKAIAAMQSAKVL